MGDTQVLDWQQRWQQPDEQAPAARRSARDRLAVHLGWEVLLAAGVGLAALLVTLAPGPGLSRSLDQLVMNGVVLGLIAVGLSFSLRAAVPNLAVGAVATAAGTCVAVLVTGGGDGDGLGVTPAVLVTVGGATAVGLLLALVVVGFGVPAWAASLGLLALLTAATASRAGSSGALVLRDTPDPSRAKWLWLTLFVALSVVGGLLGAVPAVRRLVGRPRPEGDPGRRLGVAAGAVATLALVSSTVLAALGGVLLVLRLRTATIGVGDGLLVLALGAVLLGGTSVFGRRGGILGTVLAVALVQLVLLLGVLRNWPSWTPTVVGGTCILAGLVVSRLVERLGRPRMPA